MPPPLCYCRTVRRDTRKTNFPNKSPLGSSRAREQTTETPSTEATPEHPPGLLQRAPHTPSSPVNLVPQYEAGTHSNHRHTGGGRYPGDGRGYPFTPRYPPPPATSTAVILHLTPSPLGEGRGEGPPPPSCRRRPAPRGRARIPPQPPYQRPPAISTFPQPVALFQCPIPPSTHLPEHPIRHSRENGNLRDRGWLAGLFWQEPGLVRCRRKGLYRMSEARQVGWFTVGTVAVGPSTIGLVAAGLWSAVGLVALSVINAMGLVAIGPLNCMGFVAIGGVNAMGVVAIGGINTIGVVAIGGFNATGVIAIGGVNSRSALPLM